MGLYLNLKRAVEGNEKAERELVEGLLKFGMEDKFILKEGQSHAVFLENYDDKKEFMLEVIAERILPYKKNILITTEDDKGIKGIFRKCAQQALMSKSSKTESSKILAKVKTILTKHYTAGQNKYTWDTVFSAEIKGHAEKPVLKRAGSKQSFTARTIHDFIKYLFSKYDGKLTARIILSEIEKEAGFLYDGVLLEMDEVAGLHTEDSAYFDSIHYAEMLKAEMNEELMSVLRLTLSGAVTADIEKELGLSAGSVSNRKREMEETLRVFAMRNDLNQTEILQIFAELSEKKAKK